MKTATSGRRLARVLCLAASALALGPGCGDDGAGADEEGEPTVEGEPGDTGEAQGHRRVDSRPPPMHQPVPLWENGATERMIDAVDAVDEGYVLLDLGEEWTPYIFTERGNAEEEPRPNAYRETYLALARGEFPDDHHGERARQDKYLELYGIMPTLGLLRERFRVVSRLECADGLDLTPLHEFDDFVAYRSNDKARSDAQRFNVVERQVRSILQRQGVEDVEQLDVSALDTTDQRRVRDYRALAPAHHAIRAAQARLECEGFFEGKGRYTRGALDWATHEALAEFERRHRVYGWGFIGRGTIDALRRTPAENEREAVLRVLTERAMHALGVIEDGSTSMRGEEPRTFEGADGQQHPIPNLEQELRQLLIAAFGLQTPESALAWLESFGDLGPEEERLVAFRGPALPEYYDDDMPLSVAIDRGDIWYDFPYDEEGNEVGQPVGRRPRLTVFTRYRDQRIPLARLGTTIGGWRSEFVDGTVMWKYKNSPVGERYWHQIVASPVWLPPDTTPPGDLLKRNPRGRGAEAYYINYHETGPSYASAYGLVAAYHIRSVSRGEDGNIVARGDEGIRTHGSVDYMSIMRRHSHGCHRLHNHIAVRLMSFMLAHRPHRRVGQQQLAFRRDLEHEGHSYNLAIDQGGYVFQLEEPIVVDVLEGRIRGTRTTPIEHPIPKYDREIGAYLLPDGGAVRVSRTGQMTAIPRPVPDGGVPGMDGGVLLAPAATIEPLPAGFQID